MAGSMTFTCKRCGAVHGGVSSTTVCPDCYSKGFRIALHA
jgi:rubrerythrin